MLRSRSRASDLLLALALYQFQHAELLFRDVGQRDRQPDTLRVQNAKATSNESAVRRVHRLFEQILRTAGPVADVYGLPIRTAGRAAIQLRRRRVAAPSTTKNAVGAFFVWPTEPALVQ